MKEQQVRRAMRPGAERLGQFRAPVWVMVVAVAASGALGQAEKPGPISSPLEDTWGYLVDLFRMLIGL
jgi:hypothetical protein